MDRNIRRSERIAARNRNPNTIDSTLNIVAPNTKLPKIKEPSTAINFSVSKKSGPRYTEKREYESHSDRGSSSDPSISSASTDEDACSNFSYGSQYGSGDEYELDDFVVDQDILTEYSSSLPSEPEEDMSKASPATRKRKLVRRKTVSSSSSGTSDSESDTIPTPRRKRMFMRVRRCIESSSESDTNESIAVRHRRGRSDRRAMCLVDSSSSSTSSLNSPGLPNQAFNTDATYFLPYRTRRTSTAARYSCSTSSSSNLFFTDSDGPRHPSTESSHSSGCMSATPSSSFSCLSGISTFVSEDPEEIVAFIHNSITLFTSHYREVQGLLLLILPESIKDDYQVREALREAVRLRLGRMVDQSAGGGCPNLHGNNETWVIEPVQKKSFSAYIV